MKIRMFAALPLMAVAIAACSSDTKEAATTEPSSASAAVVESEWDDFADLYAPYFTQPCVTEECFDNQVELIGTSMIPDIAELPQTGTTALLYTDIEQFNTAYTAYIVNLCGTAGGVTSSDPNCRTLQADVTQSLSDIGARLKPTVS